MVTFSSSEFRGGLLRLARPASAIVRGAMTFEDVVREHEEAVYGAVLRILGDRDAALDAANQTFMKAYRSIDSYDPTRPRSEEHTSELQSRQYLVCRLLLEKKSND